MGVVGGSRTYDGPGLGWGPWKCPACGAENQGSIDAGCVQCGSGSAKARHVGQPPPPPKPTPAPPPKPETIRLIEADMKHASWLYEAALAWEAAHTTATGSPQASLAEAFIAGYQLAQQHAQVRTMAAPPVTADVAQLAPEGKVGRTIIAALELFKDQVLQQATDEIASGEWCSVEEIDRVIQQFRDQEESR